MSAAAQLHGLNGKTTSSARFAAPMSMHKETMAILTALYDRHVEVVATETGKSKDDVAKALQASTIMTSEEAKTFGLVHEIIAKV